MGTDKSLVAIAKGIVPFFVVLLAAAILRWSQQSRPLDRPMPEDWVCPMHPEVHSDKPGVCPRCGMTLVVHVPDRIEYPIRMEQSPGNLKPGSPVMLTFRVFDPQTGLPVNHFELVHEKSMHVFLVSENLKFFDHVLPELQPDGSFRLPLCLPYGGMYRVPADYYPFGSVPQLSAKTFFLEGQSEPPQIHASLIPSKSQNLTASLRLDPEQPIAGLETKLFYTLDPVTGLELYMG